MSQAWYRVLVVIMGLLAAPGLGRAEDYISAVRKGNAALKQKKIKEALEQYYVAESQEPTTPEIQYNIGTALHEEGKYEEAVARLEKGLTTTDPLVEAAAQFNLGNTHYRMQDYMKAIESYQKALELNPADMDAKFNLELARKMLKEHTQAQQSPNQQQQQQQQRKQQQQQQDQQQDSTQQKQQQPQQRDQQQQQAARQDQKMSKEDAERILNALKESEQDMQQKRRQVRTQGDYTGKDW